MQSNFRPTGLLLLIAAAVLPAVSSAGTPAQLDPLDPLLRPAAVTKRAMTSVLIAAARAGDRIVVAGEGGVVLLSDDQGKSWSQAQVPVSVTLTGLAFVSPGKGWVVGHSGVILATTDGGKTWSKQFDGFALSSAVSGAAGSTAAESPGDPLLDVFFKDEATGFAVGAFGRMLHTADGGKTWTDWRDRLPNPDGNHLYAIRAIGSDIYVVGERGSIFMSSDGGESFVAVKSPYVGSFFGLTVAPDGGVLVFGLRGHAFQSADRGQTWSEIKVGSGSAWLGGSKLSNGTVVLVSQAGEVAVGRGPGAFTLLPDRLPPLAAVVATPDNAAVTVGVRGPVLLRLPQ